MVRNGETGLELLADNAEHFIRRTVAEEDFAGSPDTEVRDGEGAEKGRVPRKRKHNTLIDRSKMKKYRETCCRQGREIKCLLLLYWR